MDEKRNKHIISGADVSTGFLPVKVQGAEKDGNLRADKTKWRN